MHSFTVYEHRTTTAFRVVAGPHDPPPDVGGYRITIYQGHNPMAAALAAHSGTKREDIRAQIERFQQPERPAGRGHNMEPLAATPHYKRTKSRKRGLTAAAALAAFALSGCVPANLTRAPEPAPTTIVCVGSAPFATCSRTSERAHHDLMRVAQPRTGTRILPH